MIMPAMLLDTNVLSELMSHAPDETVLTRFEKQSGTVFLHYCYYSSGNSIGYCLATERKTTGWPSERR